MRALPEQRTRSAQSVACAENAQRKSSCWFDLSWKLFQKTTLGFVTADGRKKRPGCQVVQVDHDHQKTPRLP